MEEKAKTAAISEELREWQARLNESDAKWSKEVEKMNEREAVYNGERTMQPLVPGDTHRDGTLKKTSHVRNITFENIESQVSSSIPQPKVTPRRKKDEHLADVIEHFLRNELDRLPFEAINDQAERTVPIQGGVGFLVEWDNTKRTSTTVGEVNVTLIHPQQFAPQPNVYTGIADMDYFIVKVPTTKELCRAPLRRAARERGRERAGHPRRRRLDKRPQPDALHRLQAQRARRHRPLHVGERHGA